MARFLRSFALSGLWAFLFVIAASPASAQTAPAAQDEAALTEAKLFLARLDGGDLGDTYDRETTATFKTLMTRDLFMQQIGYFRVQSGGAAVAREFIGGQAFSQLPNGAHGKYYYARYRTRFPNGLLFQDVYLDKASGSWKVVGYYTMPAPQQP